MKKFRIKIVSVLLLAITFFMVHDYVILHPADIKHSQVCLYDNTVDKSMENISEVHDKIHSIFHSSLSSVTSIEFDAINIKPNTNEPTLLSYINFVPIRPPAI